jgi:formate dehydrogenase alpha subunit
MSSDNTININGNKYPFSEGQTVLEVARGNGIYIPTLCHLEGTTNTGACRVCVVEVEGVRNLVASCAMPASRNMVVFTDSPRVIESRRFVISLLMISGNHNCAVRGATQDDWGDFQMDVRDYDRSDEICDKYGNCVLQELAYRYQVHERISALRLKNLAPVYRVEDVNPFIVRDFSRCIVCGRCVKACTEVQVNNAISYGYRGVHAKIVTRGDSALLHSDCVFCGECIQVCPVGALVEKDVRYNTRYWGLERVESTCAACSVGCAVNIYVKDDAVMRIDGNTGGPVNNGSLCVKGRYGFGYLRSSERLVTPLMRKNGVQEPVEWETALGGVAEKLREIVKAYGVDSIAGIVSARYPNEDAYVMQKFFRTVIGTNNIDCSPRLYDAPAVYALHESMGLSAMTNSIAEIDTSDLIMVVGSDATESHAVVSSRIKRAVSMREKGLIVVDPRITSIARHAKYHLRPRPGSDVAWIYGFMRVIFEEHLIDEMKLKGSVENLGGLKKAAGRYTPEYVEEATGIPGPLLVEAARAYARAGAASIFYASGITQQKNGTDNVRALADLALLCGNLGIEGGGINPLRGEGNAQGVCDMGCLPDLLPGYQDVADTGARERITRQWGAEVPSNPGKSLMQILQAVEKGGIKALIVMGVDLLACLPDYARIEKTLRKLDLLVVLDIIKGETAGIANTVLPVAAIMEREGTVTNTERRVQRVRQAVKPAGQSREAWKVFVDLARLMGRPMEYGSAGQIFDEIAQVVPGYAGLNYKKLEMERGVQWGFESQDQGKIYFPKAGKGGTPRFHVVDFKLPDRGDMPFALAAGKIMKEYFHYTGSLDAVKRGVALMNPTDAVNIGLEDSGTVTITSPVGSITFEVELETDIPQGMLFIPFHPSREKVGVLISSDIEPVSGIPAYKSCGVKIETRNI